MSTSRSRNAPNESMLDTSIRYISNLISQRVLTANGRDFLQERVNYVSDQIKVAEKEGKKFFLAPLSRFFQVNLCAFRPQFFTTHSISSLTSGMDDPHYRAAYHPFQAMGGISANSPVSWVLKQDQEAAMNRNKLSSLMGGNLKNVKAFTASHIEKKWQELDLENLPANHCWYQWFHHLVIEIVAHEILGISEIPENTGKILEESEEVIIHETPPFSACKKQVVLTESQRKFARQKAIFFGLADRIVNDNKHDIIHGSGYLHTVLVESKQDDAESLDALFEDDIVQASLRFAGLGLLLAAGTLSTTLSMAFVHLNKDMNEKLNDEKRVTHDFVDDFFREALRYTSGGGHTARFISKEKTFATTDGEPVTIPKNTLVFFDLRSTNYNATLWQKPLEFAPERHQDEKAPQLSTPSFAPFSLGARACPGRMLAETIFKEVMLYLAKQNLQVNTASKFKDMTSDASPWTNKDFVTRLKPGERLVAEVVQLSAGCKLQASYGQNPSNNPGPQ